jgi:group I intron endonuclease
MNFTLVPPGVGGVYAVINTSNHKVYVGQSKNIARRMVLHKQALRSGRHECPAFQTDFDHFGEQVFMVRVLEPIYSHRDAVRIEAAWMHAFQRDGVHIYNGALVHERTHLRSTPSDLYMVGTPW